MGDSKIVVAVVVVPDWESSFARTTRKTTTKDDDEHEHEHEKEKEKEKGRRSATGSYA